MKQRSVGQRRDTGVLHATSHKIRHANVVIFCPRILDSEFIFEKPENFGSVTKRIFSNRKFARRRVKCEIEITVFCFQLLQITGHYRNQIIYVRLFLVPVKGRNSVLGFFANQFSVRQNSHAFRHVADDFGRETLVRIIVSGKPMTMTFRLALGPQMVVTFRITHRFGPKIKSRFLRLSRIGNGHACFSIRRNCFGKGDIDRIFSNDKIFNTSTGFDRGNTQINRVEFQMRERFRDRFERNCRGSFKRPISKIWSDLNFLVQHIDFTITRVFPTISSGCIIQRKPTGRFQFLAKGQVFLRTHLPAVVSVFQRGREKR